MSKAELMTKVTRSLSKAGLVIKKHSPEILVTAGVIGGVVSGVMACKATLKVDGIKEDTKHKIEKIHTAAEKGVTEAGEEYTFEDSKKDLAIVYTQTGIELAKAYGPAVLLGTASIVSVFAGHNILRTRHAATAAALTALDTSFKEYRGRVVDRFGKELDRELRYNIKATEVEETVTDEKGKEKTVKKTVQMVDTNSANDYVRFFDETCAGWERSPELNKMFLNRQQDYANDKLKAQGHLFLNEVCDMLGMPRSAIGAVVGWIYDPSRTDIDNYVDFGIYDINKPENRAFVNGYESSILLEFNVDGPIYELIEKR